MRCFIGIMIPPEIRDRLTDLQEVMTKNNLFEGKTTEPENIHLTLKFLGEIEDTDLPEIEEQLKEINWDSFIAKLQQLGTFSSKKFIRIIWAKMKGAEKLQQEIDTALIDSFSKEKRFMSHITLARVKKVTEKEKLLTTLEQIDLSTITFPVKYFSLMTSELTSEGPEYQVLKNFYANDVDD